MVTRLFANRRARTSQPPILQPPISHLQPVLQQPPISREQPLDELQCDDPSRPANATTAERTTLATVADFVHELAVDFPQVTFVVRIFCEPSRVHGEKTHIEDDVADLLYVEGPSAPSHERLKMSMAAARAAGVPQQELARVEATLVPEFAFNIQAAVDGGDVAWMNKGALLGHFAFQATRVLHESEHRQLQRMAQCLGRELVSVARLEEALSLRNHVDILLDQANAPVAVVRRDGTLQSANPLFLRLFGRTNGTLETLDARQLWGTGTYELERALALGFRGHASERVELGFALGNARIQIAFSATPIVDRFAVVQSVALVGNDVTDVRKLEEQVRSADKLATIGQLAAGVVHELNNPLTSISIYSDFLLNKAKNGALACEKSDVDKLQRIQEGASRMLRFTRDLVSYARPSAEEPALVLIDSVVAEALGFCEHVLSDARIEVQTHFGGVEPFIAVRGQLQQVFVNLITNACHAMQMRSSASGTHDATRGVLTIATGVADHCVSVHVDDNGPGIPTDSLEKVFEPFVSTKPEGKGTGLGLSIVRNIVAGHAGSITVQSVYDPARLPTADTATSFEVLLPRSDRRI